MTEIECLKVFPVSGFDEAGYQQSLQNYQRERDEYINEMIVFEERSLPYGYYFNNDNLRDDDSDYFRYMRPMRRDLGINQEALRSLLEEIGADGRYPAMATALYRAAIALPGEPAESLYGPHPNSLIEDMWYPHLFAAYLQDQREELLLATKPDALVLIQGKNRKPYRGYESVMVDTWLNKSELTERILDVPAIGKAVLRRVVTSELDFNRYSYLPLVEPDTNILQLNDTERIYLDSEWTSINDIGIKPEELNYDPDDEKYCQWDRLRNFDENEIETYEQADLIKSYKDLYEALNLDAEHLDIEHGEHYDFELDFAGVKVLNELLAEAKADPITGIAVTREDRPPGYWYGNGYDYYVNNWGDMTIRIGVERGSMTTTYTLVVFMDPEAPKEYTHLEKYHTQTRRYATKLQSEAAHLLATSQSDELEEETGLHEIDDAEYRMVVQLVDAVRAVSASMRR